MGTMLAIRTNWYTRLTTATLVTITWITLVVSVAASPQVFFYPPPYELPDRSILASPVTVSPDQVTVLFPEISEMSGVVLLVYWSQLCPKEHHCDFSIIERTLKYWQARNKKVVLSVATVGFPIKMLVDGEFRFVGATPEWLLDRIQSFVDVSRTIGVIDGNSSITVKFPSYADPQFVSAIRNLAHQLSTFDGNSALAQIRIPTGLLGEDNPSVRGLKSSMPEFTDIFWINYCRTMLSVFRNAFRQTQLEFDIGRLSWSAALGSAAVKSAVDNFVQELIGAKVLIAFDGLQSDTLEALNGSPIPSLAGPAQSLVYLFEARRKAGQFGLEAAGPLQVPRMQNLTNIAAVVERMAPNRIVLFGTDAGLLNLSRHGENDANRSTRRFVPNAIISETIRRNERLLSVISNVNEPVPSRPAVPAR
jgi:hypothetical protein